MMKNLKIENEYVGFKKEDNWAFNEYKIVIKYDKKQMTVPFKMGTGLTGEPDENAVLSSLITDYHAVENARDFEDFANDFGYDPDSRKAEKTYNQCVKQTEKFKNLLGDDLPLFIKKYENY